MVVVSSLSDITSGSGASGSGPGPGFGASSSSSSSSSSSPLQHQQQQQPFLLPSGNSNGDTVIRNAYESFQRDTPFVTKFVMTAQTVSWFISWFVDLTFALSNIPYFTVQRFEIYRLVTNLFICNSFFNLVFTYLSFVETGRRLERSMGSTAFAVLFSSFGVVSNVLYVVLSILMGVFWTMPSFGIWIVLFGIISLECATPPGGGTAEQQQRNRRLFMFEVPTKFYPLALFGIFTLLGGGGFQLGYLISIGLGYMTGWGYLDRFKVSNTTCRRWEESSSFLNGVTSLDGWVLSTSAIGGAISGGTWNDDRSAFNNGSNSTSSPLWAGGLGETTGQTVLLEDEQGTSNPTIPQSGGRQLGGGGGGVGGGPSRRMNTDAREARLKAIERRMATSRGGGNSPSGTQPQGEESV